MYNIGGNLAEDDFKKYKGGPKTLYFGLKSSSNFL